MKQNLPLAGVVNYRPNSDDASTTGSTYEETTRVAAETFVDQHSGAVYSVTIGMGPNVGSVDDEWAALEVALGDFQAKLNGGWLVAGTLTAIEMYGQNRKRASVKGLRPHAHMIVYIYNHFLSHRLTRLERWCIQRGYDVKLKPLRSPHDVARATTYATKSSRQRLVLDAVRYYYDRGPVSATVNGSVEDNPVNDIVQDSRGRGHDVTVTPFESGRAPYPVVPSYGGNTKLQIAAFLRRLCKQRGIGLHRDDDVMARIDGSRHTWSRIDDRQGWLSALAEELNAAVNMQQVLFEHGTWLLNRGQINPVQKVWPSVTFRTALWEFDHGRVYDMTCGDWVDPPPEFTSCGRYVSQGWDGVVDGACVMALLRALVEPYFVFSGHEARLQNTEVVMSFFGSLFHSLHDAGRK